MCGRSFARALIGQKCDSRFINSTGATPCAASGRRWSTRAAAIAYTDAEIGVIPSNPTSFEVMMHSFNRIAAAVVVLLAVGFIMGADDAKVTVTVNEMHVCCGACIKAIEKAVAKVPGVEAKVEQESGEEGEGMATLSAANYETIQKAIDEIAKAGFHGDLDSDKVKFAAIKTEPGNVKKLEIANIHNCCKGCSKHIEEALGEVKGVTTKSVEPKKSSFVIEGDFDPADVVKELTEAGFYPTLK
jgi:copper chaperone CopZ